jgi:hypothetical protein
MPPTARQLAKDALRSAAAEFMVRFTEPAAVQQWLTRRGVPLEGVEAGR